MASTAEIVVATLLLILSTAFIHHYFILRSGPHDPPLVKGPWPILGCALEMQRDMKTFLLENRAKHGGIFSIYVLGARIHIVSDPVDGIPMFFRNKTFIFNEFANALRLKAFVNTKEEVEDDEFGEKLLATTRNDMLSNEGTVELTRRFVEHMQPGLQRFMEEIGKEWKEVDLLDFCSRFVFELSNNAFMGPTFPKDRELYDDLLTFEDNFIRCFQMPAFMIKKEQALARKLIDRMREAYRNGLDVSQFVRARMNVSIERGHVDYIPRDLLTISWSSLTNAMPTLFWWLAYMHTKNQQSEFRAEAKRHAGDTNLANMNLANVLSSELLHSGLKETLRIHAHNLSPRNVEEDIIMKIQEKEYLLKKGSVIFAPSTLVNLNPEIYSNPEAWEVERFLDTTNPYDGATKYDAKNLKIPLLIWGAGTRAVQSFETQLIAQCPGRRFAANELLLIMSLVLLCFELAPPEGQDEFSLPAPPVKSQYGMGVKGPAEPYRVRMRVRKEVS